MTQTLSNPARYPPDPSPRGDGTLGALVAGLVSEVGPSLHLTLESSPGSVSADVRIWVYGFGLWGKPPSSPLGPPPPRDGPPALAYDPGFSPGMPARALGWWLVAEETLAVATPFAFVVPSGAIPLTVPSPAGGFAVPARTGVEVLPGIDAPGTPGAHYDPGTRFYTLAASPRFVTIPPPTPTPYSCFVALVDPVAGDYEFSVGP